MTPLMTMDEWDIMLETGDTRYVPARCCGQVIYFWRDGDQWCDAHRCAVITQWGERCTRRATSADECGQHFAKHLREMSCR